VEIGAEDGGAMFVKDDNGGGDEKDKENEIDAGIFEGGHGMRKG
jgi:hypothetical protein